MAINVKYAKEYTAIETDTICGRFDGYKTQRQDFFDTVEEMIDSYEVGEEATYYELVGMRWAEIPRGVMELAYIDRQNK